MSILAVFQNLVKMDDAVEILDIIDASDANSSNDNIIFDEWNEMKLAGNLIRDDEDKDDKEDDRRDCKVSDKEGIETNLHNIALVQCMLPDNEYKVILTLADAELRGIQT